jgi:hypothetical protein
MPPKVWIIADDWEALDRYHAELARRLPHVTFTEFPFGATALDALRESATWPQALIIDLTLEDMTPEEFHAHFLKLPPRPVAYLEIGGPEIPRPFTYEGLASQLVRLGFG